MTDMLIDSLESRHLLAGVTLLAHGMNGNIDGWVTAAAEAIAMRAGGPAAASVYTMKVRNSGGIKVTSFAPDHGYGDFRQTTSAELIIRVDWSPLATASTMARSVASALADYLVQPQGDLPPLASLPLHLVGHSKGAALVSQMARFLGQKNVVVDHVTFLDPVPVSGLPDSLNDQFGEGSIRPFDNVVFADTYWRSGGADLNGAYINGTFNGDLNNSVQQNYVVSAHGAVTAYYVGTIDTSATSGGDHPIFSSWYGDSSSKPPREQTGYAFSRLGSTAARPPTGLGSLGGGSASRASSGSSGSQWPAVVEVKPRGANSFTSGQRFNVSLRAGDADSGATARFYLDTDRNPFNTPGIEIGAIDFAKGSVAEIVASVRAAGVLAGNYALAVQVTDPSGRSVWNYGRTITIAPPAAFSEVVNRELIINGTVGGDGVLLRPHDNGTVFAQLNGGAVTHDASLFDRILVFLGDGDDILMADQSLLIPIYADGGAGNDLLCGGGGNDTLTAGAGRNTLWGHGGGDRLNGSGGRDLIYGGEGDDRLYGNGGDDTLDGGGGVDRLFGGEGNDRLIGGGSNDKLYGEAGDDTLIGGHGSDLIDGGDGFDLTDDDPNDLLTSVEGVL